MPTIYRLSNVKARVCMFPDHAPPHFHLLGPGWAAVVDIRTLKVTRGHAPRGELKEVLAWAATNKRLLLSKWNELNERED